MLVVITDHHDPDKEETVCYQQDKDWQLIGIKIYGLLLQEGAGKNQTDNLKLLVGNIIKNVDIAYFSISGCFDIFFCIFCQVKIDR